MPKSSFNRRDFLKTSALFAGAATFGFPAFVRGQNLNSKLNIAGIGLNGKGSSDVRCCASENIVALCDVDRVKSAKMIENYPDAKFFQDYRKMFDELDKGIDAVIVSTPDHTHAIIASLAMSRGKHIYCQKPLTQTVYEARQIRDLARRKKIITQMGNQGSAEDGLRRAVEVIQSGIIGDVREVHVWSNRPIWPQGMDRPTGSDPVPEGLDWDLWLGPAPLRPYKAHRDGQKGPAYHTFTWRGWQDFGTGALGDMACHTVNMPFRALQLGYPSKIEAQAFGGINKESYPIGSKIRFQFPARPGVGGAARRPAFAKGGEVMMNRTLGGKMLSPLTFWWYDGGNPKADNPYSHDGSNKPPKELTADIEALLGEIPGSGCLIIGDKGTIFSPDDYGARFLVKLKGDSKFIGAAKHPAVMAIPQVIPRNAFKGDADLRHHLEWINAIKENKPEQCYSRFDIAADLTEIMLLGCIALRVGKKLEWDGPNMKAKNCPEAAPYIQRANRTGWALTM